MSLTSLVTFQMIEIFPRFSKGKLSICLDTDGHINVQKKELKTSKPINVKDLAIILCR